MTPTDQQFLTVAQVARMFHKTPETIRRWIREKTLSANKIGRSWFVLKTTLEKTINNGACAIDCTTKDVTNV